MEAGGVQARRRREGCCVVPSKYISTWERMCVWIEWHVESAAEDHVVADG